MATVHLVKTPERWVQHAAQQDDGRTSFGEWLRRAREARGLTLADITRETKIPLRNLEALEHGDLGVVPEFYQRAEVRAFARAVGVDEGLAMGRLDSAITPVEAQPKPRVSPPAQRLVLPAVLGALAVWVLMLAVADSGRGLFGRVAPAEPQPSPPVQTAAPVSREEPVALASQRPEAGVAEVSPAIATAVTTAVATPVAAPVEPAAAIPATPAAESTEVTAPTGPFTQIVVRTEPPGAQVTVNGIGWGVSPVTIRHLPPGSKHIRVTKQGFAATERVVTLDNGQQQALDLRLGAVD